MSKRLSSGGGIAEEGLTGDDVLAEEDDGGNMSGEHGQKVSGIGLSWLEVAWVVVNCVGDGADVVAGEDGVDGAGDEK